MLVVWHVRSRNRVRTFPHEEQRRAGFEVVRHFRSGGLYVLLVALMQAGKTAAFHCVASLALDAGLVKRVVIICGSQEQKLLEQARSEVLRYHGRGASRVQVWFRHQLSSCIRQGRDDFVDTLIVWDESHCVATLGQTISKFMLDHLRIPLTGDVGPLVQRNVMFLSVSATPFAELVNIVSGSTPVKRVVYMPPGDGYWGVSHMLTHAWPVDGQPCLRPTFDVGDAEGGACFTKLLGSVGAKWVLMRVHTGAKRGRVAALAAAAGVRVLHIDSVHKGHATDIVIDEAEAREHYLVHGGPMVPHLEEAPSACTLVLLKEAFRCGNVLPKQHIGFVWEDSEHPNTDTALQGLLGRMCGYHAEATPVFLSQALFVKGHHSHQSELERFAQGVAEVEATTGHKLRPGTAVTGASIPQNGTNLVPQRAPSRPADVGGVPRYFTPAMRLHVPPDAGDEYGLRTVLFGDDSRVEGGRSNGIRGLLQLLLAAAAAADMPAAQGAEVRAQVEALLSGEEAAMVRDVGMRNLSGGKHHSGGAASVFKKCAASAESAEPFADGFGDGTGPPKPVHFLLVWPDIKDEPDATPYDVYAVFATKASGYLPVQARRPTTTGQEVFVQPVKSVGGFLSGDYVLPSDALHSQEAAQATIGRLMDEHTTYKLIAAPHSEPPSFSRDVFPHRDKHRSKFATLVRAWASERARNITALEFGRRKRGSNYVPLLRIEWERVVKRGRQAADDGALQSFT